MERRNFVQNLITLLALSPFLNVLAVAASKKDSKAKSATSTKEEPVPQGMQAASENDPVAAALGFHHDAKKTDFEKYPARKLPKNQNQFCGNCQFNTPVNKSWGKCQLITAGLVNTQGWCGSWQPKQPTKT